MFIVTSFVLIFIFIFAFEILIFYFVILFLFFNNSNFFSFFSIYFIFCISNYQNLRILLSLNYLWRTLFCSIFFCSVLFCSVLLYFVLFHNTIYSPDLFSILNHFGNKWLFLFFSFFLFRPHGKQKSHFFILFFCFAIAHLGGYWESSSQFILSSHIVPHYIVIIDSWGRGIWVER